MAETLRRFARAYLRPRSTGDDVPAIWTPFPGPQVATVHSQADEVFYGGAAGGGKTNLIVGLALTQHRRSLILRRESTHLKEIVDQLLGLHGRIGWKQIGAYGGVLRTKDGRVIECSGCKDEKDREDYKGRPHDLKAFDELPDFTESQYTFICGWNRSTHPGQRCRVVAAGNPPTRGSGDWVIRRWGPWVDTRAGKRAMPGELRWYSTIDGKEQEFENGESFQWKSYTIRPRSRTFIPASLADNPILSATNYASTLAALPEALKRAYLDGDFGVSLLDDPWQVIPTAWVRMAQDRWASERNDGPLTCAGLDVAYGGSDRTVLARRYGNWVAKLDVWPGTETADGGKTRDFVEPLLQGSAAPVNCDVIGYGAAAYEALKGVGVNAMPVNFGEGATNYTDARNVLAFANLRAACYWQLRDALDPDLGGNLALPPEDDLLGELTAAKFELRGGRIFLQPKIEIAADLGRSPDLADAVAMSVFQPFSPGFTVLVL